MTNPRQILNPNSKILSSAVVGGVGLSIPPEALSFPEGMAAVILFVPVEQIVGKTIPEIQQDLGLSWYIESGNGYRFE